MILLQDYLCPHHREVGASADGHASAPPSEAAAAAPAAGAQAHDNENNPTRLTLKDKKVCKGTAILQSITKIGAQGAMKSHRKSFHEVPTHIIQA
jgi:hypothetical protein